MLEKSYRDNEDAFLEKIADKFMLKDKTRLVFIERFKIDNDDLNNQKLADVLSKNLLHNTGKKAGAKIILRDCLSKTIFKKLEVEGCDFNGVKRDKVEIAKQWLREIFYPWHLLKNMAVSTNKMGPVIPGISDLNMYTPNSNYRNTIPAGTDIKFEVQLERPGYLTLLEKGTTGEFFCLSPSSLFAPYPNFKEASKVLLPMEGAPIKVFELSSEPGVEEIIVAYDED